MIPGIEGRHAWTPPGEAGPLVTLGYREEADGLPVFPRVELLDIGGLHSLADPEDVSDPLIGRTGEVPRLSYRRGKTISYEGWVEALSLQSFRGYAADLRAAFGDQSSEGRMDVTWLARLIAPRTNLATNPKAGDGTTASWTNTGLVSFDPVASLPGTGWPEGVTTGFHCVGNASDDRAILPFAVTADLTYRVSCYFHITSLSAVSLLFRVLDSLGAVVVSAPALTTVGSVLRADVAFTATETAEWDLVFRQNGAGAADWTFSAVLIEESPDLGDYFDGDSITGEWQGSPETSQSSIGGDPEGVFYEARAMGLEIGEPVLSRSLYRGPFVLALRNHDGRYYLQQETVSELEGLGTNDLVEFGAGV